MPDHRSLPRLMWNYQERDAVIARAAELRRTTPTLSQLDALMVAQKDVLPEKRQKKKFFGYLKGVLTQRLSDIEEKARKTPPAAEPASEPIPAFPIFQASPEPEPAPEAAGAAQPPEEPAPATPAPEPIPHHLPTTPTTADMCREIGTAFGLALVRELGPMLLTAMKETINAQLVTAVQEAMLEYDKEEEPGKPQHATWRRSRVAIVGLLPQQRRTVQAAFPHVDFRWLDNGAAGRTVREVSSTCDEVYLMTKFISHQAQNCVDRNKRVMVNGGISDLTRLLGARYANSH